MGDRYIAMDRAPRYRMTTGTDTGGYRLGFGARSSRGSVSVMTEGTSGLMNITGNNVRSCLGVTCLRSCRSRVAMTTGTSGNAIYQTGMVHGGMRIPVSADRGMTFVTLGRVRGIPTGSDNRGNRSAVLMTGQTCGRTCRLGVELQGCSIIYIGRCMTAGRTV